MPDQRRLRVPNDIVDLIRKTHPHLKKKIKASLNTISKDPESGKVLKGDLRGLSSFRVSRFRIIYRISSNTEIQIIAIGPRAQIYDETFRILKRERNS